MPDAVAWLTALFSDLGIRAPHGISWEIDRADPPLHLRVGLADGPVAALVLRDDGPLARIAVAEQVQAHVDACWEVALPPCPDHDVGLVATRAGDEVRWRCPDGDVDCAVGDYDELLWPPRPVDADRAGSLLGDRLRRRSVTGLSRWSVHDGVITAHVREGADEAALRAAADPFRVEITWVPPAGWARTQTAEGDTLSVTNSVISLARFEGVLSRSASGGLQLGDTELRLSFEHRVGPPGGPLLLDADGVPFAEEGDQVICGGGFLPSGPVRNAPGVILAGRVTRVPAAGGPAGKPAVQP